MNAIIISAIVSILICIEGYFIVKRLITIWIQDVFNNVFNEVVKRGYVDISGVRYKVVSEPEYVQSRSVVILRSDDVTN